jgi:hypothetical protein
MKKSELLTGRKIEAVKVCDVYKLSAAVKSSG